MKINGMDLEWNEALLNGLECEKIEFGYCGIYGSSGERMWKGGL
jgi:hypothetical protein